MFFPYLFQRQRYNFFLTYKKIFTKNENFLSFFNKYFPFNRKIKGVSYSLMIPSPTSSPGEDDQKRGKEAVVEGITGQRKEFGQ